MYTVYCDDVKIYDLFTDLYLINPILKLELNSPGSFTFALPADHPYYDLDQVMLSRVTVYRDDDQIFCGRVVSESIDFYKRKTLICEGELAFLNDSIQRPAEYHDMTVRGYLQTLIDSHNEQVESDKQSTVGIVTVSDSNDSLYRYTNYNSTMQEIKEDLVDDLGGYLRVRYQNGIRYLDYVTLTDYGNTNDEAIRFGTNLLDFTEDIDATDIATVIIPLGARLEESPIAALDMRLTIEDVNSGRDYLQSDDAVATYGKIVKTVIWDDVTTASNLLSKGQRYLSDTQWDGVQLTATAVDMNLTDAQLDAFSLGDQLRVVSNPHGLDRYFPLSKMTLDLDNPENNSYTLGATVSASLVGQLVTQTDVSNQLGNLSAAISSRTADAIENANSEVLNEAREIATQLITAATASGHVVLDPPYDEILIMDTDNKDTAQRVWRWNLNGLGYSSTGYNGTYGTAITMDGGIVADYITAGTMYADRIKGGTLTLGGSSNGYGKMSILDSNGAEVGSWNRNGITAAAGTIGGWTINNDYLGNTLTGPDDVHRYVSGAYLGADGIAFSINSGTSSATGMRTAMSLRPSKGLVVYCSENSTNDNDAVIRIAGTQSWASIGLGEYTNFGQGDIVYGNCGYTVIRTDRTQLYDTSGNLWLETRNGNKSLYVNGSYLSSSDMALKTDIENLSSKYDALFDFLQPKTYHLKGQPEEEFHMGFVYQDVVEGLEEAGIDPAESALVEEVEVDEETHETVGAIAYNEIIALLTKEVQMLKTEVKELEAEIQTLKSQEG